VIELRQGRWEEALADVNEVDAVISDPPYSARTHDGHDAGVEFAAGGSTFEITERRELSYSAWTADDIDAFVSYWAPRNRGWFVCLSDSDLCPIWREVYESHGLTGFAPVVILIPGMTVRLAGDGPSSWGIYANVARPKALSKWGTLDGGYKGPPGERVHVGGKPLWLMRALVRDYTKRGDLIVDPCAGAATTLLAAAAENRRAVGAEVDPKTYALAMARIQRGYTPSLDFGDGTNG